MVMPEYLTGLSNDDIKAQAGRVAVVMGGLSAEREISLLSGAAVSDALIRQGIEIITIDWQADIIAALHAVSFDRVFIALHGRGGEDGALQGLLELMGVPYTGSRVSASAIAMDKVRTKLLWCGLSVPTPVFDLVTNDDDPEQLVESVGLPMIVKPAREGSSIGISKVKSSDELAAAIELAAGYDDVVFAESWVEGSEHSIPILNDQALPMIRFETPHEFYDYDAKYIADTTRYICPCGLDEALEKEIAEIGRLAFEAVGASGWGRVDLIVDERNQPWFIELNTVPGLTGHSLVPMSAQAAGLSFDDLVLQILGTSFG